MLFNSFAFFVFFVAVLLVYTLIPRLLRRYFLLVASFFFYMCWNPTYALLMLTSIATTYICGLLLARQQRVGRKKLLVAAVFAVNLLILFFFKYFNFLADTVAALLGLLGIVPAGKTHIDVLLPVGISFYTFQALGYIIDVYRGDIDAERKFSRYALFVSFFPQLVAGPIERSTQLLDQVRKIETMPRPTAGRIYSGLMYMVWGLFLKMVIADRAALFVDSVFGSYWHFGTVTLSLAAVCFYIQIYCDFASYSTIAIGAARMLGFDLMENFNTPLFAESIRDFWRRWHISLSTWFKDYLYIPLGGNRVSKWRTRLNTMIVFIVSGVWHGANWTFVLWGFIHGSYQVLGQILAPARKFILHTLKMNTDCFSFRLLRIFCTFFLTTIAWIFFRAESISSALDYIWRMFTKPDFWVLFDKSIYNIGLDRDQFGVLMFAVLLLAAVGLLKRVKNLTIDRFLLSQNTWFQWLVILSLVMLTFVFGEYGPAFDVKQFLYFQF